MSHFSATFSRSASCLCIYILFVIKNFLVIPTSAENRPEWVEIIENPQVKGAYPEHSPSREKFALNPASFSHYFSEFNADDEDLYNENQLIPNNQAWSALKNNIPLLDCPDATLERTYYFRWWTFRKHIKRAKIIRAPPANSRHNANSSNFLFPVDEAGKTYYVITEFLPTVSWSGLANTISCAAAHHFREGRWLHTTSYLESYAKFWFVNDAGGEGGGKSSPIFLLGG